MKLQKKIVVAGKWNTKEFFADVVEIIDECI